VYDEFFLPANLTDQMEHARWLDLLNLPLEDRYMLSLCPISTKSPMLEKALQDWSRYRAQRRVSRLEELADPRGRNELQFLEDSCKLYTAYAWLGFRMPDTFPDEEKAQQLMQSSSEQIDRLLQAQNTRHRRSFSKERPSEREERRPQHPRGRRYRSPRS
jgi:ATP-dependent RNA helicase SUPV3L1/SUV3